MSNDVRSFGPLYTRTQYVQSGASSALSQQGQCATSVTVVAVDATAVPSTAFVNGAVNELQQIRVANKTSVWVHVNFGRLDASNSQSVRAATINDLPIAPGGVDIFTVDPEVNAASVFANGAPAGSTSVMFTRGSGT